MRTFLRRTLKALALALLVSSCQPDIPPSECNESDYANVPACYHLPGYRSVISYQNIQTEAMKTAGIRKLIPSAVYSLYESPYGNILLLNITVDCDDLSKFLFPTLTFNDSFTGSNYPLSEYASYAKTFNVNFVDEISCDKAHTYALQSAASMNVAGEWISGKFSGNITLAYNVSNTFFEHLEDNKLAQTVFFLRPLFEGDDCNYVYPLVHSYHKTAIEEEPPNPALP
jgi:hypothetical protein